MIIVNKERNEAFNIANITNIYIGADNGGLKAVTTGVTRCGNLGKYNTCEETKEAFLMLMEKLEKNNGTVVYMPQEEEVRLRMRNKPLPARHHITGKKTKGHGGS